MSVRWTPGGAVFGGLFPMRWSYVEKIHGQLFAMEGTPLRSRDRTPLPEHQEKSWVMNWPKPPFPDSLCCWEGMSGVFKGLFYFL